VKLKERIIRHTIMGAW